MTAPAPPPTSIYHEPQSWSLCALHTVNAILMNAGIPRASPYTSSDLNAIAATLDGGWGWSHRSALGGDFDANVVTVALSTWGLSCHWHDGRTRVHAATLARPSVVACVLNASDMAPARALYQRGERIAPSWWSRAVKALRLGSGQHWSALCRSRGVWFDADSLLHVAAEVGGDDDAARFAQCVLDTGGHVILVCWDGGSH